jgi:hypothetical protein
MARMGLKASGAWIGAATEMKTIRPDSATDLVIAPFCSGVASIVLRGRATP